MKRRNTAQQIYHALGADIFVDEYDSHGRNSSFTKKGPGRKHKQGK